MSIPQPCTAWSRHLPLSPPPGVADSICPPDETGGLVLSELPMSFSSSAEAAGSHLGGEQSKLIKEAVRSCLCLLILA